MDDTAIPMLKQRSLGTSKAPITNWALKTQDPNLIHNESAQPSVRSLYVHIPFCFHKCHYCDFYSIVDKQDRQEAFLQRMINEIRAQAKITDHPTLDTIFMGGGTPTLLAPQLLAQLLDALAEEFEITPNTEWTIETNPETLTDQVTEVLQSSAVNRISMGGQSFNPIHLKALERHHDPESVFTSMERAHRAGFTRLSLDLIYAIPGQTFEQWTEDLAKALSLPIDHLSAYALTYEPNTAMTKRLMRGDFESAPDELEVQMYNHTLSTIRSHGMERYEVSNHAIKGSACLHNIAYWRGHNWLAVGPSASGHLDGMRWKNTPRLEEYIQTSDEGFAPINELEMPDPARTLMDKLMMGIRIQDGLDREQVLTEAETLHKAAQLDSSFNACIEQGWAVESGARILLTDLGFHYADGVARELIGAIMDDED
ncbi:MAG: radical SAM family heme chaperone HemW [Phycisphaerales bacterium]